MYQNGLIDETEGLILKYGNDLQMLKTIGYGEARSIINGKINYEEAEYFIEGEATSYRQVDGTDYMPLAPAVSPTPFDFNPCAAGGPACPYFGGQVPTTHSVTISYDVNTLSVSIDGVEIGVVDDAEGLFVVEVLAAGFDREHTPPRARTRRDAVGGPPHRHANHTANRNSDHETHSCHSRPAP